MNPSTPSIHAAQVLPARAVLFLGIIGLHVVFAYLFANGLTRETEWTESDAADLVLPVG